MNEVIRLNTKFVNDYILYIKGDDEKSDNLLKYAFYLLTTKQDELSFNFSYNIIINYCLRTRNFTPLLEFSIVFGYSPILEIIYNCHKCEHITEIEKFIGQYYIEDNRYHNKILTNGQKILYSMIEDECDYSIVAPTSFGKTEMMLESALRSEGDCIIIVPLIALLNQIKSNLKNMANDIGKKIKIITHHEIKKSNDVKNIYILTQERCFELIKNDLFHNITDLFIDEAHKLLFKSERTYKLSQIIVMLKKQFNCRVRYYSPVLNNALSIKIKGLHSSKISSVDGIRDMKCYNYYFYKDYKKYIYIPNTERLTKDYVIDEHYENSNDYILKNSKNKNIVFYNSPKDVERNALDFSHYLNCECDIELRDLEEFIGSDYYIFDTLKKGIIYIHGQMPDLIKDYLLNIYRKNPKIKYLFTNSSILEGINTPSDNLFICDYKVGKNVMTYKDFINLRGRINRINEVVTHKDLKKLLCDIHFIVFGDSIKQRIRNNIIDPCYGIKLMDDTNNEYLQTFNNDEVSSEFVDTLKQIKLIDNKININDIYDENIEVPDNTIERDCLINNIILNVNQKKDIDIRFQNYKNAQINDIEELIQCMVDLFMLNKSNEIELARLANESAIKFYSMLMNWIIESKSIKAKASLMTNYYKNVSNNELIYVGKRGDLCAEMFNGKLEVRLDGLSKYRTNKYGNRIKLKKVWVKNNRNQKDLFNICVVKIKMEEDFISFKLLPFVETIRAIEPTIISENLYRLIKYRTIDSTEIEMIKEGCSIYLARELNKEKYKSKIKFGETGIVIDKGIINMFEGNDILKNELNSII